MPMPNAILSGGNGKECHLFSDTRKVQTLRDAAPRIAGCSFVDLGDSDAQKVFNEAMPDITSEKIEAVMR
jgi:hypothetical protein